MLGANSNGTAASTEGAQNVKSSRNPLVRFLKGLAFSAMALITSFIVAGLANSLLHPLAGIIPAVAGVIGAGVFFWEGCKGATFNDIIDKYGTTEPTKPFVGPQPVRVLPASLAQMSDAGLEPSASAAPQYPWTPTTFSTDWSMRDGQFVKKPTGFPWLLRWVIGIALFVIAILCLVLGLLPGTLIAGIVGYYCLPISGTSGIGAWVGPCPSCNTEVAFSDPSRSAMLTPLRNLCPTCKEPIEIVRDRFVAIPGTGVPPRS